MKKLKRHLSKGNIKGVINTLLDLYEKTDNEKMYNELVIISSRLDNYYKEKRIGFYSASEQQRVITKINHDLLAIIDQLEEEVSLPIDAIQDIPKKGKDKYKYVWQIIGFLILVSTIGIGWMIFNDTRSPNKKDQGYSYDKHPIRIGPEVKQKGGTNKPVEALDESFETPPPKANKNNTAIEQPLLEDINEDKITDVQSKTHRHYELVEIDSAKLSFRIAKYEVTIAQYIDYCKERGLPIPERVDTSSQHNLPVTGIKWDEAMKYCEYIGGNLPTINQWKIAAAGGLEEAPYLYSGSNVPQTVAWYVGNSKKAMPIGTKKPNRLGLYDMTGNVQEYCADTALHKRDYRYAKGGSWKNPKSQLTIDYHTTLHHSNFWNDATGFRVVFNKKN